MQYDAVPQGRLKIVQERAPAYISRPSGTGRPFKPNPGLASRAKFSRPCGTGYGDGSFTILTALRQARFNAINKLHLQKASCVIWTAERTTENYPLSVQLLTHQLIQQSRVRLSL
jgi:hypothetical protein